MTEIRLKTVLKTLLKEKDITPAKLSRLTKVPPQTIHNWLSGQEPRKLGQLKTVANYLGVSIDFLLFGIREKDIVKQ